MMTERKIHNFLKKRAINVAETLNTYKRHLTKQQAIQDKNRMMKIVELVRKSNNQSNTLIEALRGVPKTSGLWHLVKDKLLIYDDVDEDVILWLKLQ